MADFSDAEDKLLFQGAFGYVSTGRAIDWDSLVACIGKRRLSRNVLRERLKTLKKTYGKDMLKFPRRFFASSSPARVVAQSPRFPLCHDVSVAMSTLYDRLPKKAIAQPPGQMHLNAGEVSIQGVSVLLAALRLTELDVFGDIGSGVGNVLVQVALQTGVRECIGVEIRRDLVDITNNAISQYKCEYAAVQKLKVFLCGIEDTADPGVTALRMCTVIFANNKVFQEEANQKLEAFVCDTPSLTKFVVSKPFCHRHRDGCARLFCILWRMTSTIEVAVLWTSVKQEMYLFEPRVSDS